MNIKDLHLGRVVFVPRTLDHTKYDPAHVVGFTHNCVEEPVVVVQLPKFVPVGSPDKNINDFTEIRAIHPSNIIADLDEIS